MISQRVIYLNNLDLVIYDWDDGILTLRTTLTDSDSDKKNFADLVKQQPAVKTYVLVDVIEEEFQNNTLPHVFIKDRQAFIARQLNKAFRNTHYRYADFRGRETSGQRGDLVFFSALTNPALIDPWLSILLQYKVSIAGIYSFSLVVTRLLNELTPDRGHVLLITQQKESIRLSFFTNNQLKMSRVTRFADTGEIDDAQLIVDEVGKTQRYLTRLRLLSVEGELSINVVASDKVIHSLRLNKTRDNWDFKGMSVAEVAVIVQVEQAASDHLTEWLIAQFLCKKSFADHYSVASQRRYLVMRNVVVPSKILSVVCCVAAMIWSTMNLLDIVGLHQALNEAQQQTQHHISRYQTLEAVLPPAPVSADAMKAGVNTAEQLMTEATSPASLMIAVSQILSTHKQLWIDTIDWKIEQRVLNMPASPIDVELIDPLDPTEIPDELDDISIEKRVRVARIEGKIKPFDGNLRHATEQVQVFLAALSKQPMVQDVIPVILPFNAKSTERTTGSLGLANKTNQGASFVVEIITNEYQK